MIQILEDVIEKFDRLNPARNAPMTLGFDRLPETIDVAAKVAKLRRRRQRVIRQNEADRSAVETIKNAINSTIGRRVHGLQVSIEDDRVVVKATVPSFYVRQLVEHKARSIVVEHLRKKLVPRVVVENWN